MRYVQGCVAYILKNKPQQGQKKLLSLTVMGVLWTVFHLFAMDTVQTNLYWRKLSVCSIHLKLKLDHYGRKSSFDPLRQGLPENQLNPKILGFNPLPDNYFQCKYDYLVCTICLHAPQVPPEPSVHQPSDHTSIPP